MSEAPQIASLGQDDERSDRADPRNRAKALIVWMGREQRVSLLLEFRTHLAQVQITRQLQPKGHHSDGVCIDRQRNAVYCETMDLLDLCLLMNSAPHRLPDLVAKLRRAKLCDGCWSWITQAIE